MKIIELDEGTYIIGAYRIPTGGWLLKTRKNSPQITNTLFLVYPDKDYQVIEGNYRVYLSGRKDKLVARPVAKNGGTISKNFYFDENGNLTRNASFGIDYSARIIESDNYICHSCSPLTKKSFIGKWEAYQIAAGMADGGIIIIRRSDRNYKCFSIKSTNEPLFSFDELSILCYEGNKITIIDNPFVD